MRKLIIILLLLIFSTPGFAKEKFKRVYNSPHFNIYMKKVISGNKLIIKGILANNYWEPIINSFIYVDAIDKNGKVIEKKEAYVDEIDPCPDSSCQKPFVLKFNKGKKIVKLRFSINFYYAAWKIDQDDWDFFTIKISNIQS